MPEAIGVLTEPVRLVEDCKREVVVGCEAGVEDVRSTGGKAPKRKAKEKVVMSGAQIELLWRAAEEEAARHRHEKKNLKKKGRTVGGHPQL